MATAKFKGKPISTVGDLPAVGATAPDFTLVNGSLEDVTLANFAGKKKILSIVHSLDTGVCQSATKTFSKLIGGRNDAVILVISKDLPFAQKRFCTAEGIDNVVTLSAFRSSFGKDYGVEMLDGPIKGLTARSVVVLDEKNKVVYTQLLDEVTNEPDHEKAIAALGA